MDNYTKQLIEISIAALVSIIFVGIVQIKIDSAAIPTLLNGITSATSVSVGFCGTIIGLMFRDFKKDKETKNFCLKAIVALLLPLTFLWTTYVYLAINTDIFGVSSSIIAIRWGLSGLIMALYIFFVVVLFTVRKLSPNGDI
jgi:hypothetical protein